jgi:hypothetical protein
MIRAAFIVVLYIGCGPAHAQSWSPIREERSSSWNSDEKWAADDSYRALRDVKGGKSWQPEDRDYYFSLQVVSTLIQKQTNKCLSTQATRTDFWQDAYDYLFGNTTPPRSSLIIVNSKFRIQEDIDSESVIFNAPLVTAGYGINATEKKPGNGCFIDSIRRKINSKFIRYRGSRSVEKDTYIVTLEPIRTETVSNANIRALTRSATVAVSIFNLTPFTPSGGALINELNRYEEELNKARSGSASGRPVAITVTPFDDPSGSVKSVRVFGANVGGTITFSVYRRASHILDALPERAVTAQRVLDLEIPYDNGRKAISELLEEKWPPYKNVPVFSVDPAKVSELHNACEKLRDVVTVKSKLSTLDALIIRLAVSYKYRLNEILTETYLKEAGPILKKMGPSYTPDALVEMCLVQSDIALARAVAEKAKKPLSFLK